MLYIIKHTILISLALLAIITSTKSQITLNNNKINNNNNICYIKNNNICTSYKKKKINITIHNNFIKNKKISHINQNYFNNKNKIQYPILHIYDVKNKLLIQKGEYIAKIADCISCHTNSKTHPFSGGLKISTPFGNFYTPNITPDKKTGIGNWSEKDFINAMKNGKNPNGKNYFPVFPYIYFSKITNNDLHALYAYFMHIPPIKQKNKPLSFPFNLPGFRYIIHGWNFLFFNKSKNKEKNFYNKNQNFYWKRGEYIVNSLGHCGMCHTPLNIFGAPKKKFFLSGAFIDGYWAPNITKNGLSYFHIKDIVDVFNKNKLLGQNSPITGPMTEVNHNSLIYLTKKDKISIATYLKNINTINPIWINNENEKPSNSKTGKIIYKNSCIMCHYNGEMGAPTIFDAENWFMRIKYSNIKTLYKHTIYGYNNMPIKGNCLNCSKTDIVNAVNYILNNALNISQWRNIINKK
ncbi:c-type cytochrome [Candidatus Legionella polyplacis]|uniref:C-type cytochrome n=1 Tax=Candidatus Legionella polyplacis TaxID=2005262 RepID=A0ABZ2GV45_9GAMM